MSPVLLNLIVFALLLGAILIAVMGLDVGVAYTALLEGAFGSKNAIGETACRKKARGYAH